MCMLFACISVASCQTAGICFQTFTQCHIPKIVILIPPRYTVKKPTGIPVSLDAPQISTLRYDTTLKSGNKKSTERYDSESLFASL